MLTIYRFEARGEPSFPAYISRLKTSWYPAVEPGPMEATDRHSTVLEGPIWYRFAGRAVSGWPTGIADEAPKRKVHSRGRQSQEGFSSGEAISMVFPSVLFSLGTTNYWLRKRTEYNIKIIST